MTTIYHLLLHLFILLLLPSQLCPQAQLHTAIYFQKKKTKLIQKMEFSARLL